MTRLPPYFKLFMLATLFLTLLIVSHTYAIENRDFNTQDATLTIGSGEVPLGGSITVPMTVTLGSENLGAATIDIQYDPNVLTVTGCSADPDNAFDFAQCNPNFASDTVRFAALSGSGVSGDLLLAEITFQAVGEPEESSVLASAGFCVYSFMWREIMYWIFSRAVSISSKS